MDLYEVAGATAVRVNGMCVQEAWYGAYKWKVAKRNFGHLLLGLISDNSDDSLLKHHWHPIGWIANNLQIW